MQTAVTFMSTKDNFTTLSILATLTGIAFGQSGGPLTPPAGPPGRTMKSLDQMEPRTPLIAGAHGVSVAPGGTITISQSGSYYLTSNLSVTEGDGILITANRVTLDLRGFTITSSTASSFGEGIDIDGSQVTVFNGHIVSGTTYNFGAAGDQYTGPGFDHGVYAVSSTSQNIHIYNLSVVGCDFFGISISSADSLVESCTVRTTGSTGISAGVVTGCTATQCGQNALSAHSAVHNSQGESTSTNGIFAPLVNNSYGKSTGTSSPASGILSSRIVVNSSGVSQSGDGINGSVVNSSYGYSFGQTTLSSGIRASRTVINCYGVSTEASGGDGISSDIVGFSSGLSNGNSPGAVGIQAAIAIGCLSDGGEIIADKYLMP